MDGLGPKSSAQRPRERLLVRRSRLLAAIEEADRRTVLLVAPAGYGKTTLARQWLEDAPGAWVTVTSASADIPVLARDLAAAIGQVATLDLRRVETALSAGKTAADQARVVSRTILAQIKEPLGGWIVVDDYHLLMANPAAEDLIATLEATGRFRFMVTSREQPSWATPRRRVYLETFEIGLSDLALDDAEIAQLLPPDRRTVGLRSQARGWPAVIALAAHAGASDLPLSADAISATLYDYFAEELFEHASQEVQRFLTTIAVLPPVRVEDLRRFLKAEGVVEEVVSTGLAYEANGHVEVHPLARVFLTTKLRARTDALEVARASLDLAIDGGLYDHAFGLIREFGLNEWLERLITASYPALIDTGRIATLQAFGKYAAAHGSVPQHLLDLIGAEAALIDGRLEQAHSLGGAAAAAVVRGHPLKARGYLIAGRAAHLGFRFDESFRLHSNAGISAVSASDGNDAAWGKCLAALFLESDRAANAIQEFASLKSPRPTDRVRLACARFNYIHLTSDGRFDDEAREIWDLLPTVTDPWVRSSWRYTFGQALVLQARYDQAQSVIRGTLGEMDEFGLSFGLAHAEWSLAAAELGLRHFSRCGALLRKLERRVSQRRDVYVELNHRALGARLQLAQQRPLEAVELTRDEYGEYPSRSMYGEYLATRALALAVIGDDGAARATASRALSLTGAVETNVLCAGVLALISLRAPSRSLDSVDALLETASNLNVWDGVVCAVRASPELLLRLAMRPDHRTELREVLLRSNDLALAKSVGLVTRLTGSNGLLSPREREILDHVRQGKRNTEIATSLFISPGTVKSHMDHIFDKLGVRSRAGAVARYAEIENAATDASSGSSEL